MDGDLVMATQGQGLTQRVPRGSPKGRRAPFDAADMQALDSEIEAQEGLLDGDAENGDQTEILKTTRFQTRSCAVQSVQAFATAQGKAARVYAKQNGGSNVTLRCATRLGDTKETRGLLVCGSSPRRLLLPVISANNMRVVVTILSFRCYLWLVPCRSLCPPVCYIVVPLLTQLLTRVCP